MPTVTVRDARHDDARAIAAIWAVVDPHRVRSPARAAASVRRPSPFGPRSWVASVGDRVVGTASARLLDTSDPGGGSDPRDGSGGAVGAAPEAARRRSRPGGPRDVLLGVEVLPDHGSRGVGTALLSAAARAFDDVDTLRAVGTDGPVTMAFAIRNGFLPDGEHRLSVVQPAEVEGPGPVPPGLRPRALDTLADLAVLADAHNAAVADEPHGLVGRVSVAALRAWFDDPDAAPELSWALVDERGRTPALVSFCLAEVDRERAAGWCGTTATVPDQRGRGHDGWVRRRTLASLHRAGVPQAWTEVDTADVAMLALDERIGFVPAGRYVRLARRVPR